MFLAPLTTALTTIKHCQFGHRCPAVINDGNQADGGEPAGSSGGTAAETASPAKPAHVERVTKKKAKDPKKGGGRACRRCRPAKATLEQLQAAKELLRPPVSAADNDGTSASPKEAKHTDERPEPNWIPWIIGVVWRMVHLRMPMRAKTCSCAPVLRRWPQVPRPKSRINLPN